MVIKEILLIASLIFCTAQSAQADLRLRPPAELLAKATKSRVDCREVILDILANISEMRDPTTFDAYFGILEELDAIAKRVDIESIYPDAVRNLGYKMAAAGLRWLDVTKQPAKKIIFHHRWMSLDSAYSFFSTVEKQALHVDAENQLRQLALNVEALIEFLPKTFPDNEDLPKSYRRVLSELAGRRFQDPKTSDEAANFWLAKIVVSSGFNPALSGLETAVLSLQRESIQDAHRIARRILAIGELMRRKKQEVPAYLFTQLNDITVNLIIKQSGLFEPFSPGVFEKLVRSLSVHGLISLAQSWNTYDRLPPREYSEHYLALSRFLFERLRALKLDREVADFSRFIGRVSASIVTQIRGIEGTYAMKDAHGKSSIFNIAHTRPAEVCAGLTYPERNLNKGFFLVQYSLQDDAFVASQRDTDTDHPANLTARFRVFPGGKIEVLDLSAPVGSQLLHGRKIQNYPDYLSRARPDAVSPSGTYEGMVTFRQGYRIHVSLVVTTFNGFTLGRLAARDLMLYVDFNIGSKGTDGVLYLTTGRIPTAAWVQMRGVVNGKEYRGQVVTGGSGLSKQDFVMKKVSRN